MAGQIRYPIENLGVSLRAFLHSLLELNRVVPEWRPHFVPGTPEAEALAHFTAAAADVRSGFAALWRFLPMLCRQSILETQEKHIGLTIPGGMFRRRPDGVSRENLERDG